MKKFPVCLIQENPPAGEEGLAHKDRDPIEEGQGRNLWEGAKLPNKNKNKRDKVGLEAETGKEEVGNKVSRKALKKIRNRFLKKLALSAKLLQLKWCKN